MHKAHHDLVAETIVEDTALRFNRVVTLAPLVIVRSVRGGDLRICKFVKPSLQLTQIRPVRFDTLFHGFTILGTQMLPRLKDRCTTCNGQGTSRRESYGPRT